MVFKIKVQITISIMVICCNCTIKYVKLLTCDISRTKESIQGRQVRTGSLICCLCPYLQKSVHAVKLAMDLLVMQCLYCISMIECIILFNLSADMDMWPLTKPIIILLCRTQHIRLQLGMNKYILNVKRNPVRKSNWY